MIALVDYGAGNLTSVCKALRAAGGVPRIVRSAGDLGTPEAIVVPGVGHFLATGALDERWRAAILGHVSAGRPLLGICLGMQWLFDGSDEAPGCPGLGVLSGTVRRLQPDDRGGAGHPASARLGDASPRLKVPHVGWNQVRQLRASSTLDGVADLSYAYFTHSYAAPVTADSVAIATHGDDFAAVVEKGPVWGVQFHPEKSGDVGLRILGNFIARSSGPC